MNKKKISRNAAALLCAGLLLTAGCGTAAPAPSPSAAPTGTPEPEIRTATLFLAGDALLHEGVWLEGNGWGASATFDFMPIIGEIGSCAEKYDLAYYNQESTLGGTALGLSGYPYFNSPQEFGRDMVLSGFNLVSTANNHSLDTGETGIAASEAFWDTQTGAVQTGTAASEEEAGTIEVHEVNGITYAFLSWTYGCNGIQPPQGKEWMVNIYGDGVTYPDRRQEMLDQIAEADRLADAVIIAVHWGTEYTTTPNQDQMTLAQQMADAGADIIIGNHPHAIQPVQWLNDGRTICFYAMGNLVSEQDGVEQNVGLAGALTIRKTVSGSTSETVIEDVKTDLFYCYHDAYYRNLHVYPFPSLNDSLLPDHDAVYAYYAENVVRQMDPSIPVGGIFE